MNPIGACRVECDAGVLGLTVPGTSSVAAFSEQLAHLYLVLSCDKQGTSAKCERCTRFRMLVAKQLDA